MIAARIMSVFFILLALTCLIMLLKGYGKWSKSVYRRYLIGVTAVYLSGTVLIAAVLFFAPVLQVQFAVASELCVLFMFIMSGFTVIRLGENMDAIREEIEAKKMSSAIEDIEKEIDQDGKET